MSLSDVEIVCCRGQGEVVGGGVCQVGAYLRKVALERGEVGEG